MASFVLSFELFEVTLTFDHRIWTVSSKFEKIPQGVPEILFTGWRNDGQPKKYKPQRAVSQDQKLQTLSNLLLSWSINNRMSVKSLVDHSRLTNSDPSRITSIFLSSAVVCQTSFFIINSIIILRLARRNNIYFFNHGHLFAATQLYFLSSKGLQCPQQSAVTVKHTPLYSICRGRHIILAVLRYSTTSPHQMWFSVQISALLNHKHMVMMSFFSVGWHTHTQCFHFTPVMVHFSEAMPL